MKLPFTEALDDSKLDSVVTRAKDYNAPMHELMRTAREYALMQQRVTLPPGVRKTKIEVKNAFVWDMTQRMTAATIKNWVSRPDRWAPWPERNGDSPSKYGETVRRWKMARFPFTWRAVDPLCYN